MKDGPAGWMAKRIETVGELRELLADLDGGTPLTVAGTPDVNGWTSHILAQLGRDEDRPGVVVLALAEETATDEPATLVFPVRPV